MVDSDYESTELEEKKYIIYLNQYGSFEKLGSGLAAPLPRLQMATHLTLASVIISHYWKMTGSMCQYE